MVVPPLDEFKVADAEVKGGGDMHIALSFTDPLQKNQQLAGLVSISKYNGRLKFVIDRNVLKVYPTGRIVGERKVTVRSGVKNINGVKMPKTSEWNVAISDAKPQLEISRTRHDYAEF